jgi:insulin-like growth factor 2 mRNA-binding protein 1
LLLENIIQMNGFNQGLETMGVLLQQDSAAANRRRPSNRLEIHNLPNPYTKDGIEQLLSEYGTLKKFTIANSAAGPYVSVIYDTPEEAQTAVEKLNNFVYEGSQLSVEIMNNNPASGRLNRGRPTRNPGVPGVNRGTGYPLRIMVPSEYVGAIIGRKGQTIKSITQRCKARVDVHGKENTGLIEKVISIFGQPENCTNACKEILQVMQHESTSNNRGEIMLKMITDDRFCGRIIGKEGKMIKKIREDTSTKITVSNAQEMAALFPDRVIAIRGTIDNMCLAEAAISAKLQECYEQDQGQNMPGMMMPMPLGPNAGGYYSNPRPYDHGQNFYPSAVYPPPPPPPPPMQQPGGMMPPAGEVCQISVPNAAVGAIIGAGGSNIKQMMRESGAFVNIESKKDGDPSVERVVTIKGNPDACWRASYMVFEKMKSEGFAGNDEVRLKTAIRIPKTFVGRIIGKSGKNVRELQRVTGAMIKLPEDPATQGDEVTVEVFGNFMSTQSAHGRIRALVSQIHQHNFNGVMVPRGPRPGGPPPVRPAPMQAQEVQQ